MATRLQGKCNKTGVNIWSHWLDIYRALYFYLCISVTHTHKQSFQINNSNNVSREKFNFWRKWVRAFFSREFNLRGRFEDDFLNRSQKAAQVFLINNSPLLLLLLLLLMLMLLLLLCFFVGKATGIRVTEKTKIRE